MADIEDTGQKELIDGHRGEHAVASQVLPAESHEGDPERSLGTTQEQALDPGYRFDPDGTCPGHATGLTYDPSPTLFARKGHGPSGRFVGSGAGAPYGSSCRSGYERAERQEPRTPIPRLWMRDTRAMNRPALENGGRQTTNGGPRGSNGRTSIGESVGDAGHGARSIAGNG